MRKKWTKEEVAVIIKMKKEGYTLKAIGNKLSVTTNAARKALQRYLPLYSKPKRALEFVEPINATIHSIIEWGKSRGLVVERNKDLFFKGEKVKSLYLCILEINKSRINAGMPIFQVRA